MISRVLLPVIQRVAPQLPVRGEIVGRHAGNGFGVAVTVDFQDFPVRPGVRAVERNIDRHVTEQLNTLLMGVGAQHFPLVVEQELQDLDVCNLAVGSCLQLGQCVRVAVHVFRIPLRPRSLAMLRFEYAEKCIVVQPGRVVPGDEGVAGRPQRVVRPIFEAAGGGSQQAALDRDEGTVVDVIRGQLREGRCFFLG